MCGIGGILRITPPGEKHEPIPEAWLDALDAGIAWRGPDGAGRFRDRVTRPDGTVVEVALVHRRLAIIDIEGGAQPMVLRASECPACEAALQKRHQGIKPSRHQVADPGPRTPDPDPRLAVVFNGCIYNHRELREELEAKGHVFRTDHSDTEVILHLASDWPGDWPEVFSDPDPELGPPLLGELQGMFAIAVWDSALGFVAIGRDRFGEKPLVHTDFLSGRVHVFASSSDTVERVRRAVAHLGTEALSAHRLADALCLGFTSESSVHEDVFRAFDLFTSIGRVWDHPPLSLAQKSAGCLLSVLAVAVLLSIVCSAIVALAYSVAWAMGILLSTGLLWILLKLPIPWIVARSIRAARKRPTASPQRLTEFEHLLELSVAHRLEADVPLGCFLSGGVDSSLVALMASRHVPDLRTLTVRMPDDRYDESRFAELVADHLGTRHTTLECDGSTAADDLVRLIRAMGLPFGDSSILPTWWLCRGAKQHIKVALAGDGGDELFYGYDRYKASRYLWWPMRWLVAMHPQRALDRSDPKSLDERKARLITAARHAGYLDLLAIFPTPDRRRLLGRARGDVVGKQHPGSSASAMRWFDQEHYLPGDLLRKVDTASMLAGVEVRLPFLDSTLADAALSVPALDHMAQGEGKHILKQIARKHLPREVVDRPKMGFAVPISDWLRTDFGGLGTLMMERLSKERPFGRVHEELNINIGFVRGMIDEHRAAGGMRPLFTSRAARPRDHGQRLFALTTLAIWAQTLEA